MRWAILLLLFSSFSAFAQHPLNDDYFLFETAEHVRVNAAAQDSIGLMWLGTQVGLFHFNGQGDLLAVYEKQPSPVTAVGIVHGVIYAGYNDGSLAIVINDTINKIRLRNAKPASAIHEIMTDASGVMWLGTEEGLFAVINNTGYRVSTANGLSDDFIYSVARAPGKGLMTGTDKGVNIVSYHTGKLNIKNITTEDGLPDNIIRVVKSTASSKYVWIGTDANGIARMEQRANSQYKIIDYGGVWAWGQVNDIIIISDDHVWVGTDGYILDVILKDTISVTPYTFDNKNYLKLLRSPSGNIWCATNRGLSSISAEFLAFIDLGHPYSMQDLTSMTCDKDNTLWFAEKNLLYKTAVSGVIKPELACTLPDEISTLFTDKNNTVWIGTLSKGLWYTSGSGTAKQLTDIKELRDQYVISINSQGRHLWVATISGVFEIDVSGKSPSVVIHHSKSEIGSNFVYQLYSDHKGRLWMATDGAGIRMYDGRQFYNWDTISGFTSKVFYSLTEDSSGHIWAASLNNGLFKYNGKTWKRFTNENGLQDLNISTVMANATGQVVIVHQAGVDEWYPTSVQFRHFNQRTGPSIDSTSTVINLAARDNEGNVYIPATKGILMFKNIANTLLLKPNIRITKVGVYLKPVRFGKKDFSYSENHVSFQYVGVNTSNIEHLYYRYKLEGYNDNWVATTEESLSFPQLAPGKYVFRIQASLDKDFEEAKEASYSFTVLRPLWRRPWMLAVIALVLVATVYGYTKLRVKNVKRLSKLQEERLRFEYEHLRSQVNPHFLFNSLNTLTSLIDETNEDAIDYTVQLSDLYRNILMYREKDLISLGEECKILSAYIHIQKTRFGEALQVQHEIPDSLLQSKMIIPLALQLLVENAIKHNVVSRSSPLIVRITADENEIVVRNQLQPKVSKEKGAGLGTENIRQRYKLLTKKEVRFGVDGNEYVVKLPLL